jgi:hypothetical protein
VEASNQSIGSIDRRISNGGAGNDVLNGGPSTIASPSRTAGNGQCRHDPGRLLSCQRPYLVDNVVFGGLPTGLLSADAFVIGTAAQDRRPFHLQPQTGQLWFDPHGNGTQSASQFAILDPASVLGASDVQ